VAGTTGGARPVNGPSAGDNEIRPISWFYCTRGGWLPSGSSNKRSKPVQTPKPFTVYQDAKPILTVYAYTLAQARQIVAAKVAGETIVVATPAGAGR
jgi:hypothetical protein